MTPPLFHGEAATTVLLREGGAGLEVLLLERPRRGSFAGAWVFPGGHIEAEDFAGQDAARAGAILASPGSGPAADGVLLAAARTAGAREAWEETGIGLDPAALVPLSCWVPPAETPKRLRTWFFLARAPLREVRLNAREHVDHVWLPPAEALARHGAGSTVLMPPTWVTLHWLDRSAGVGEALSAARAAAPEIFRSRRHAGGDGREYVVWEGDAEYGGGARPEGPRHRLDVTSLPWTYQRTG
ncbi:NUDIX hydrolase [Zafaria cholistanensis]|uniref:NUDIX hydrolase n=1 Tax=Zafaria cholistanensis TaxID=1682741 RepID=A0A5A7NQ90_9MICC|nr:NUDIX hydrolase [Zafaria cholistanensis]GER22716.1 NUDIX hydrolase [Zafaria cholistanensis]